MVELRINGNLIELEKGGDEIKITRQIADVFDLSVVSSSYTNSFSIPKTPNNTQVMEFLGLVGDKSSIPYSKNEANVKYGGFDSIPKGWLTVSQTDNEYKTSIIDGMIDFFKAIEGKTIGTDLNLSNFTHEKTLENIINSYDNEYYSYIIADYNGKLQVKTQSLPNVFAINIDALVPSFNVKKLFEIILFTFGYIYISTELDLFLDGLWITYPTPPIYENTEEDIVADLQKLTWVAAPQKVGDRYVVPSQNYWSTSLLNEGSLIENWKYVIGDTAGFRFNLKTQAYAQYTLGSSINKPLLVQIIKNGTPFAYTETDPLSEVEIDANVFCQIGDVIELSFYVLKQADGGKFLNKFHHLNTEFNIYKITQGDVTPVNAFSNFKITDFFKEILYRTGLTPLANNVTKQITFISISERLNRSNAKDCSSKFVGRLKENYLKGSYAQSNYFKMKYNNEGDKRNDGVITVNNQNIEPEKTLAQSLFYSPVEGLSDVKDTKSPAVGITKVIILPMWSKDISINDEDETEISYKPLDNRFYFIRRESKHSDDGWQLASDVILGNETVNDLWFANTENTLLGSLVNQNYADYSKIFQNFRSYDFELALGLEDLLSLNLTIPYYFSQESAYFMINKITYQQGKKATAECVKINYI